MLSPRVVLMFGLGVLNSAGLVSPTFSSDNAATKVVSPLSIEEPRFGREGRDQDEQLISAILTEQVAAWNRGDLKAFMATYWNSPELTFSAGGQTTRGWQATFDRYARRYPAGNMGKLHFDGLEVSLLGSEAAFVLGNWHLEQDGKKMQGNFTLVLRRVEGKWLIVHDHSSSLEDK